MKLLVLGGTRFLGRHIVDAALERGDDVTIFTRGRLPVPWKQGVTAVTGERDPRISPGLSALDVGVWDAVVDCSGYVPRVVEASARMLASRAALPVRLVDVGLRRGGAPGAGRAHAGGGAR